MRTPVPKETAKAKIARKFDQLYIPLTELIDALQTIEPGGTLLDPVKLESSAAGHVELEYVAQPKMLTITTEQRKLILRVLEV